MRYTGWCESSGGHNSQNSRCFNAFRFNSINIILLMDDVNVLTTCDRCRKLPARPSYIPASSLGGSIGAKQTICTLTLVDINHRTAIFDFRNVLLGSLTSQSVISYLHLSTRNRRERLTEEDESTWLFRKQMGRAITELFKCFRDQSELFIIVVINVSLLSR